MARTVAQIEASIDANDTIKEFEYFKDYMVKKFNKAITDVNDELQKTHSHVSGLDKIVLSTNNLIAFSEDITYHTTTTPGEARLDYSDVSTGLLRTSIMVDAITGVGIDTFTYKTNIDIKKRIAETNTTFGGTFELNQSSVSYSLPTDSGKNFQFTGNKGDSYAVSYSNGKIEIRTFGNATLTVDGVAKVADTVAHVIDTPADYWGTDGRMKITFTSPNNTLVDGGKFLRLTSNVHPHNLKTYTWETIKANTGGAITEVYELHFNPSTPGGSDGKVERVELKKA